VACSTNILTVGADLLLFLLFFSCAARGPGVKGISVRQLAKKYKLTSLTTYQHGARRALNMQRLYAASSPTPWAYPSDGLSSTANDAPYDSSFDAGTSKPMPVSGSSETTRIPPLALI